MSNIISRLEIHLLLNFLSDFARGRLLVAELLRGDALGHGLAWDGLGGWGCPRQLLADRFVNVGGLEKLSLLHFKKRGDLVFKFNLLYI